MGIIFYSMGCYAKLIERFGNPLVIACSNMLVQLPFLFILPKFMGVDGVWLAMPLSNIALCSVVIPLVYFDVKKRRLLGNHHLNTINAVTT